MNAEQLWLTLTSEGVVVALEACEYAVEYMGQRDQLRINDTGSLYAAAYFGEPVIVCGKLLPLTTDRMERWAIFAARCQNGERP